TVAGGTGSAMLDAAAPEPRPPYPARHKLRGRRSRIRVRTQGGRGPRSVAAHRSRPGRPRSFAASARQGHPTAGARDDRERRMSKGDPAPQPDGRGPTGAARDATNAPQGQGATTATHAGQPEFVQLLTPDGERLPSARDNYGHEYTVDFTDDEYR